MQSKFRERRPAGSAFAAAGSVAVAVLLLGLAVLELVQGIAVAREASWLSSVPRYRYRFSSTTWTWIHIVDSIVLTVVGIGLLAGAARARTATVVLAAVTIAINFLWLPRAPLWSIIVIAGCAIAIWAVTAWRPEEM
ncbi:hypothetical protein [Nocardia sp. NPDC024068]|uniref:DUF7144 family membrane protein n=1 Tax=Nocardia sp. NPDC024068 TaxID=3157197 RepID=UPI0033D67FDF